MKITIPHDNGRRGLWAPQRPASHNRLSFMLFCEYYFNKTGLLLTLLKTQSHQFSQMPAL